MGLFTPLFGGTVPDGGKAEMGHVRLGVLPKSRKWRQVVEELRLEAEIDVVASSAAHAADGALRTASNDPSFLHAFWLLTQVPLAARGPGFSQDLLRLGVQVPDHPSLMDLVAGIREPSIAMPANRGAHRPWRDGSMSAVESFAALVGPSLPSLFEPNPGEVQRSVGRFAGGIASALWRASSLHD